MILHKIADKIIFNILKRISVGYLEITSISGELLKFGNYEDKLKADLKIKSSALSYNLIKNPTQVAKFLVWVQNNRACMHMLNELWQKEYNSQSADEDKKSDDDHKESLTSSLG